jgi:hypothetical protein
MSNAIFIGWGPAVRGREGKSLEVFGEALAYWTGLQQRGEVESFETYQLEQHGGDLGGFLIAKGDPEKLARICNSEEFVRLNARASFVVENFGVVRAWTGDAMQQLFGIFGSMAAEFGA